MQTLGEHQIEAAIAGDRDAAARVWEASRRWVAVVLLAHMPRDADLDDLLQSVAMTMVRKIGEVRDPGGFRPWLRTVAINTARGAGRERQRRARLRAGHEAGDGLPPSEETVGASEEAARLMRLARTLPESYREPLLLRCVRGLGHRQIGELLGLPETTVETRIARGRRMLRELAARDRTGEEARPPCTTTNATS